jgi:predicted small lipoprotein YifL
MSGKFVRIVALLVVVLALAGCGKKAAPQAPPGEPDTFPRVYPRE